MLVLLLISSINHVRRLMVLVMILVFLGRCSGTPNKRFPQPRSGHVERSEAGLRAHQSLTCLGRPSAGVGWIVILDFGFITCTSACGFSPTFRDGLAKHILNPPPPSINARAAMLGTPSSTLAPSFLTCHRYAGQLSRSSRSSGAPETSTLLPNVAQCL